MRALSGVCTTRTGHVGKATCRWILLATPSIVRCAQRRWLVEERNVAQKSAMLSWSPFLDDAQENWRGPEFQG